MNKISFNGASSGRAGIFERHDGMNVDCFISIFLGALGGLGG
jgi:hypothetical protein